MSKTDFAEIIIPMPWGHVAGRWYGNQTQRPLIAIHGWLDNCGTFARLAPLLQSYTSILCIDLPGHGHSTHIPAGILYTNMEFVRVLLRLMNAYKWEKISLMGHSMGGVVAFIFTSLYPDRVDMLIGFDIITELSFSKDMMLSAIRYTMDRAIIDNERILLQTTMNEPPCYTYEECEQLLYKGTEYSIFLENCKYLLERNLGKSLKFPNKYYFTRDGRLKYLSIFNLSTIMIQQMMKRICRNHIPHLVIKGEASTNINSQRMTLVLPICETENRNFEIHSIKNGTHHLHLNNPEEVADIIIKFWQRKHWPNNINGEKANSVDQNNNQLQSKL